MIVNILRRFQSFLSYFPIAGHTERAPKTSKHLKNPPSYPYYTKLSLNWFSLPASKVACLSGNLQNVTG